MSRRSRPIITLGLFLTSQFVFGQGQKPNILVIIDDVGQKNISAIANNTTVIFTIDNGPNQFSWQDAATTPFRSEKDTNCEGHSEYPL
jgi:hypothetical protein